MTGVVFFSRDGSTRVLAKLIEKDKGAELIELRDPKDRHDIIGFIKGGFQASAKRQVKLDGEPWKQAEACDLLYLCTPIWASNGTPALNTFLRQADLNGRRIVIITVMADSRLKGIEKTHAYLSSVVERKGGKVEKCIALHGAAPGKCAEEAYFKQQLADKNF